MAYLDYPGLQRYHGRVQGEIEELKDDLSFWGGKNLLESLTKSSFTNKGITWVWNGNSCTVNGTATATANNDIYSSSSVMPTAFEAGKTYHVYYSSTNINLRIYAYHSVGGSTELCSTKTDIDVTIPADAIGMIIRLNIPSGTVVNETVDPVISTNYTTSKLLDVIERNTIITPKPVETISVDMLEKGGWAAGSKTDSRSENRARTKMLLYASKPIDIYRKYDHSNALIFTHYYDITGAVISSASWAQSALIPEGSIFTIIITESNSSLTERTVEELYNMFHVVTVDKEIITDYNSAQWTFSRGGISSNNNWLYDIQDGKQFAVNQYFKADRHFVRISCETGYSVALIGYNEQFEIVKKQTDFGDKTGTVYVDMEGCSYFRCFVICPSVSTTEEDILNDVSITKNEPISVEYAKDNNILSISKDGINAENKDYAPKYPKSSIISFQKAYDQGFRVLEIHVQFTSDDVPVVFHDLYINNWARNTDGSEISTRINIRENTIDALDSYDFGVMFGSQYAGTKITRLPEALEFVKYRGMKVIIEPTIQLTLAQYKIICDLLKEYGLQTNCAMYSQAIGVLTSVRSQLDYCDLIFGPIAEETFMSQLDDYLALEGKGNLYIFNSSIFETYSEENLNTIMESGKIKFMCQILTGIEPENYITERLNNPHWSAIVSEVVPAYSALQKISL